MLGGSPALCLYDRLQHDISQGKLSETELTYTVRLFYHLLLLPEPRAVDVFYEGSEGHGRLNVNSRGPFRR